MTVSSCLNIAVVKETYLTLYSKFMNCGKMATLKSADQVKRTCT
jgi:hypothetical protein